jgi:hypothetical protein
MRSDLARHRPHAAERVATLCEGTQDRAASVDLRAFQTDQRLHQRIFESPAITSWKSDRKSLLHLFLDSMDEGSFVSTTSQRPSGEKNADDNPIHARMVGSPAWNPLRGLSSNRGCGSFDHARLLRPVDLAGKRYAVDSYCCNTKWARIATVGCPGLLGPPPSQIPQPARREDQCEAPCPPSAQSIQTKKTWPRDLVISP